MSWHALPAEVYALVERSPASVLLEQGRPRPASSVSRLFLEPLRVCEVFDPAAIPSLFIEIENAVAAGHYAAGFFTYECGEVFEPKANLADPKPNQPLAWFGIYADCYTFDHAAGHFTAGTPPGLAEMVAVSFFESEAFSTKFHPIPGLSEAEFAQRIQAIHELIRAGDVYQLNFTFPLHALTTGSPAVHYACLRRRQPVDYGAYLHWRSGNHILSFSPELFFRIESDGGARRITTQPMKGTAPRGRTTAEDARIAESLRNDAKNRSENVMIVDLLRNDLGRLCSFGSVRVDELFVVERYPTLWQMTSTIAGELRPGIGYHRILRALFPCGSITGAPKVRAMQLLAGLEGEPRGVYTGAIGFFSREQTIFNVAIRTLQIEGETSTMGIGSGIVIDSIAEQEYRECQLKAAFLTQNSEPFSLIETMLWQGNFPLIELHLDRLTDSADYFGFACDHAAIKDALMRLATKLQGVPAQRVRLLLDADGSLHIEYEALTQGNSKSRESLARVCIASHHTNSSDRFLFHKTTNRALYSNAFKTASAAGFSDALFLNERGEVTEGAVSNVFVEKDGHLSTPPIECGVLPGVYRRHLLATRPEIQEKILTIDDLKSADAIYIANAIRGLRKVTVDWSNSNKAES